MKAIGVDFDRDTSKEDQEVAEDDLKVGNIGRVARTIHDVFGIHIGKGD